MESKKGLVSEIPIGDIEAQIAKENEEYERRDIAFAEQDGPIIILKSDTEFYQLVREVIKTVPAANIEGVLNFEAYGISSGSKSNETYLGECKEKGVIPNSSLTINPNGMEIGSGSGASGGNCLDPSQINEWYLDAILSGGKIHDLIFKVKEKNDIKFLEEKIWDKVVSEGYIFNGGNLHIPLKYNPRKSFFNISDNNYSRLLGILHLSEYLIGRGRGKRIMKLRLYDCYKIEDSRLGLYTNEELAFFKDDIAEQDNLDKWFKTLKEKYEK